MKNGENKGKRDEELSHSDEELRRMIEVVEDGRGGRQWPKNRIMRRARCSEEVKSEGRRKEAQTKMKGLKRRKGLNSRDKLEVVMIAGCSLLVLIYHVSCPSRQSLMPDKTIMAPYMELHARRVYKEIYLFGLFAQ